jgi:hypothetical protein
VRWPPKDLENRVMASDNPILTDDYAPVDRLLGTLLRTTE